MICRNCGMDVPEGYAHCYNCGAPVAASPEPPAAPVASCCVYCGTPLAEGSVFCTNCGQQQPTSVSVTPVEKKPFPMKLLLLVGGGLVLIAALIIVLVCCGGNSPEAVAEEYVERICDGDVRGAMELMPEAVLEYAADDEDVDIDEMIEQVEENFVDYLEKYGIEMTVEDIGEADYLKKKEIKNLQKQYDDMDIEIEDAAEVEIEISMEFDEDLLPDYMDVDNLEEMSSYTETIPLIQVDGDWYVGMSSFAGLGF